MGTNDFTGGEPAPGASNAQSVRVVGPDTATASAAHGFGAPGATPAVGSDG